jgi:hypothetical protein
MATVYQGKDPHKAIEWMMANVEAISSAKENLVQLEEFTKSLRAILMKRSLESSLGAQEREALAHPEYIDHLKGVAVAVGEYEKLRHYFDIAKLVVDVWRTEQSNLRAEGRVTI